LKRTSQRDCFTVSFDKAGEKKVIDTFVEKG